MPQNSFLFGERIPKETPDDKGWKTLYDGRQENPKLSDDTLLNKKSVLFFPGGGAVNPTTANGCCKSVQGMLQRSGIQEEDMPHLYGFGYITTQIDEHRYQVLTQLKQAQFGTEYTPEKQEEPPYYQPFFDEYIMPLIVNQKGQAWPQEKIKQNLQNITFVSYCQGGFVAWQIEKMMADKLAELYPESMPKLMNNIRMIHFASRRPKGQAVLGKHLDIMMQEDEIFADHKVLEYDDIHQQIHRLPLSQPTALIPVSPNEEILLLKKITPEQSDQYDPYLNHTQILQIFSGEYENLLPENEPAIRLACQLLRHFVEHPQDKKSIEEQMIALNPDFVKENQEWNKTVLQGEQEDGQMRRGLLSLITDWGARLAHRKKRNHSQDDWNFPANDVLRQHDDKGRFLYNELKKRYLQDHDSESLIHYLKGTNAEMSPTERGHLALLAIQNQDWKLFKNLGGKKDILYIAPHQLPPILTAIQPDDLHHIILFLKNNLLSLQKNPEAMVLLMRKIKKIKKENTKKTLELFFKKRLESCFHAQKETLRSLLWEASLNEKKAIKNALKEKRQTKARELFSLKQERDTQAPDLLIQEYGAFKETQRQYKEATLDDFRQFKTAHQKNQDLSFRAFMANKQQSK